LCEIKKSVAANKLNILCREIIVVIQTLP